MSFGSGDFVKLFGDFGKTATFEIVPAVRSPTGSCVDESGCDWEKATLCAFDQVDVAGQVTFLACMDEKRSGAPADAAKDCASSQSLDYEKITKCMGGKQSQKLLEAASTAFNKALPGHTTIPHTFVNDKDVSPNYSSMKTALCDAGSTSSACKSKDLLGMHFIETCEA